MWIKAKVLKDIEGSEHCHYIPKGGIVYASRCGNRVDLLALGGRINTIPAEKESEYLEYELLEGRYVVKYDTDNLLRERFVRIWNRVK